MKAEEAKANGGVKAMAVKAMADDGSDFVRELFLKDTSDLKNCYPVKAKLTADLLQFPEDFEDPTLKLKTLVCEISIMSTCHIIALYVF